MFKTPILLLTFNRPDTTKKVFDAIRKAKPKKLYVATDGPRSGKAGEEAKVQDAHTIATCIDWECEVKTLLRDRNLGCKKAVSGAISWFFEHENEGIILEDDCVPDLSFFSFCQDLLSRYRRDTRVMMISGNNFQYDKKRTEYSYYFSRYPHCWGWATWKRAWKYWDGDLAIWPEIKATGFLNDIAAGNEVFVTYWGKIFDKCYAGKIDSWAYPWTYSCWIQSGLTILPNENLVSNIGFGEEATHTKKKNTKVANLPTAKISFPLRHPPYMIRDSIADLNTDKNHFGILAPTPSIACRLLQKLERKVCH